MKKSILLSLSLLILWTYSLAQSSKEDTDSTYKSFFRGTVNGESCFCWTNKVANELMQDVQNSIDCDSMQSGLQEELITSNQIVKSQQLELKAQESIISTLKSTDSISQAIIDLCKIESVKELSAAKRKIWILKAERIIYPIATAALLIAIYLIPK